MCWSSVELSCGHGAFGFNLGARNEEEPAVNNKKPCSRLIISTIASTIAMYLGLLSGSARAVDQSTLGAHGGKVLSSGHGSVEVKLDRPSGQVSVYLSRKEEHPDGVVITFFNQGQPPFSLELKALTP